MSCAGCDDRKGDPDGVFSMRFVGRPKGKIMKGAPGNYNHGQIYKMPFHLSRLKYWELMEPLPEFVAPELAPEDAVFAELSEEPAYISGDTEGIDDLSFSNGTLGMGALEINLDPDTPASIEPYMHYSPSTDTLSKYVPPEKPSEEEPEEEDKPEKPDRDALKQLLAEAGIKYKKGTRTTTLKKLVDGLAAKE